MQQFRSFLYQAWRPIATKFRNKLIVALFGVSLVPLAALAYALFQTSSGAITQQAFNQLDAVRTIKSTQVQDYFRTIQNQIGTFADDKMIVEALRDFRATFHKVREENSVTPQDMEFARNELRKYYLGDFSKEYERRTTQVPNVTDPYTKLEDDSAYLQYLYVKTNPNPLGSKHQWDAATDKSTYSKFHGVYHPIIRNYLEKFGYYDIFLADIDTGHIVYTCFKELDFTTSMKNGAYANTNIGRAFQKAATLPKGEVILVDYEPYFPSYEDAASFIAAPVFDGENRIGVAMFQMPIAKINSIMEERTGLGETGETYAVGPDHLFRNDSRFKKEMGANTTIINTKHPVKTEAANGALAGETGIRVIDDYRNVKALSSWGPITVFDGNGRKDDAINWALVSQIGYEEVRNPSKQMANTTVLLALLAAGFVAVVSYFFSKSVTKQTDSISNMLGGIGMGDFESRAEVLSEDELGTLALSLNAMCDNTLTLIQSREERDKIQTSIEQLIQEVSGIANGDLTSEAPITEDITGTIAGGINNMVNQLRRIVSNVKDATLQVGASANQIRTTTEHLSRGSEAQASQIVDTSAAIGEMSASIQQVAENTVRSSEVALQSKEAASKGAKAVQDMIDNMNRIRSQVQDTSKRIKRLGESSQEIGEIVQLISDIADRTSILALNASIQAAMAGDAGQGFAVVAEEVERLAERCNDATKQISTLIKAIQGETSEAIAGMEESTREVVDGSKLAVQAGQRLDEIDTVSAQLADLIQTISLAAKQQARGADALSKSMSEISDVTQQTAAGTKQAAVSAGHLTKLADDLRSSVSTFKLPSQYERSERRPGHGNREETSTFPTFPSATGDYSFSNSEG